MRPSPLALTVLFMLLGEPLHPYEMQRRMKLWGKDEVVNVAQRATLYKTIERLHQAGLIRVRSTERDQRFPERTVYELTEDGMRVGREWLVDMLATPISEFPRFPAALSFIFALAPEEALGVLEQRATVLAENLERLERNLDPGNGPVPPRVALLDGDFLRAMTQAEFDWVRGVIDELRSGRLSWTGQELVEAARLFLADC